MTRENSKKLYDHYVKIGYEKAFKDLLKKYPEFKQVEKPKKEEPETNSKKK